MPAIFMSISSRPLRNAHSALTAGSAVGVQPRGVAPTVLHRLRVTTRQFAGHVIVAKVERAVLSDDRIDRPHPRDVIAPPGRPARDRDHQQARVAQPLHRRVRRSRDPSVGRQRVVDVGEDAAHRRELAAIEDGEGSHAA